MKKILYLFYYLKQLDWHKFWRFTNYVLNNYDFTRVSLYVDILRCVFRYNISILDYFYFRFFEKEPSERSSYAGTGFMYEYQLKMNPKEDRDSLENKLKFLEKYKDFIGHKHSKIEGLDLDHIVSYAKEQKLDKFVLKGSRGQCGEGVKVIDMSKENLKGLDRSDYSEYDLMEEYIVQHKDLMRLSPSGLNTVRVFTQIDKKGEIQLLGSRLRITVDSHVDNLAAGNLAAPIDEKTGIVSGPGVYSDITKQSEKTHPVTGRSIVGFQIPFWKETLDLILRAARHDPRNRSIGWDVAITDRGPFLLEGNHNWCKLLWQLPVQKGMKSKLELYL